MQFELTEALVDDILFSMEDQHGNFLFDTVKGIVVDSNTGDDASRFIRLPEWDSSSGFRLMERFAAGLKNPPVRRELTAALDRGKGVFRAFKDTLGRYPEMEKLWFTYKEEKMKQEILQWYNGLREAWGMEKLGTEPEDTADLVLEDFCFRAFCKGDFAQAENLHRLCLQECGKNAEEAAAESVADTGIVAETVSGEFAGYITGTIRNAALHIQHLEVQPEFRGLGIGQTLLARFLSGVNTNGITEVFLDLPAHSESFSRVLLRESFKPHTVRYSRSAVVH